MDDKDLTVINNGKLTKIISGGELGTLIKPLVNEIHLFDTFVAGTTYLKDASVLERIKVDDKLSLVREDNKYDSNAIIIKNEADEKLGYVPEKDNVIFARLMDAGKMLMAKIKKIEKKGSFVQISVGIFLIDF